MTPAKLRLFFAVPLPSAIRAQLYQCIAQMPGLRQLGIRVTPEENLHLTLKFLGETSAQRLSEIQQAAVAAAETVAPFSLQLRQGGVFPNERKPRIIWIGMEPPAQLEALAENLNVACMAIGCSEEKKPFSPHITLARVSDYAPPVPAPALKKILDGIDGLTLPPAQASQLILYQSDLSSGAPIYRTIFTQNLNSVLISNGNDSEKRREFWKH